MRSAAHLSTKADARGAGVYDDGHLRVEHDNYYVSCRGEQLLLTRTEFLVLSLLTRQPGRFVPPEEIWRYAWGDHSRLNIGTLKVQIHRLRRRLAPFGVRIENRALGGYGINPNHSPLEKSL